MFLKLSYQAHIWWQIWMKSINPLESVNKTKMVTNHFGWLGSLRGNSEHRLWWLGIIASVWLWNFFNGGFAKSKVDKSSTFRLVKTIHYKRRAWIFALHQSNTFVIMYLDCQNIKIVSWISLIIANVLEYRISGNSFLPWIVSPFNSFRGNYSIYEVKNYHNAETIWKFPHFTLSKKNSFRGNYSRKHGIWKRPFKITFLAIYRLQVHITKVLLWWRAKIHARLL
jgi:hypothetical protein